MSASRAASSSRTRTGAPLENALEKQGLAAPKRGHVCPPSTATHPRDRWETAFVYAFVKKFIVNGKDKTQIQGLDSPMDLENALLSSQPEPVLEQILTRFVKNLRPKKGSGPAEAISHTASLVVAEYLKLPEHSIFWDEELEVNMNPLGDDVGFFSAPWDTKLRVLRQMVEWQLSYCQVIREKLDVAWGVQHNLHKRKPGDPAPKAPPPDDPDSKESLKMVPMGQDINKRRYWIVDDSPRLYASTNPWKVNATFETVSTTLDEYRKAIEDLKTHMPPQEPGVKRKKFETMHMDLIKTLEARIELIEQDIARVDRARKKAEKDAAFARQAAELRENRTRRQTRKAQYVYTDGASDQEQDDGDDYKQEHEEEDDEYDFESVESNSIARRRSTRKAALNTNGKRSAPVDDWQTGERRSTRQLAAALAQQEKERTTKRARTKSESPPAIELPNKGGHFPVPQQRNKVVKDNELVVDAVAGKKKSKFWVYAVENGGQPITNVQNAEDWKSTETSVDEDSTHGPFGRRKESDAASAVSSPTSVDMDISEDDK